MQEKIKIILPHPSSTSIHKITPHEPPKPFFYSNGCMKATSITKSHQRFSAKNIHPEEGKETSYLYKKEESYGTLANCQKEGCNHQIVGAHCFDLKLNWTLVGV